VSNETSVRGRGRPARVSRAKIIAAARAMDPSVLSIQAVASALGVDRKTIRYHVRDRDELTRLVAQDAFRAELALADVDEQIEWQASLRSFARVVRDASVASGYGSNLELAGAALDLEALGPAEVASRALLQAGFAQIDASGLLRTVGVLSTGFARELLAEERDGLHAQRDTVQRALAEREDAALGALRALAAGANDLDSRSAFEFALDVVVVGAQQTLVAPRD